jgi:hypothetical protein
MAPGAPPATSASVSCWSDAFEVAPLGVAAAEVAPKMVAARHTNVAHASSIVLRR